MPLCNSNCMVFAIFLIVHTLCNHSSKSLQCILLILCMNVTDILKMCMKKFNDITETLHSLIWVTFFYFGQLML